MRRVPTLVAALGLTLVGGCPVSPLLLQLAVTAVVATGTYAARTAIYQSVEAFMDELVRPWLREVGGRGGGIEVDPQDPLRGTLRGRISFIREEPRPRKEKTLGAVAVVRDTPDGDWRIDPVYIRLIKDQLEARTMTVQPQTR